MAVYAKKLSPKWRKAFAEFERMSGFEMMHQDDIDAGEMTPYEAWNRNIAWLEDLLTEVQHIETPMSERDFADAFPRLATPAKED